MHVPDGFINIQVSAATGLLSFGTLWAYIRSAKTLIADKFIALTGMMSALIFVLQMINFPIAAGTSGHLLGLYMLTWTPPVDKVRTMSRNLSLAMRPSAYI